MNIEGMKELLWSSEESRVMNLELLLTFLSLDRVQLRSYPLMGMLIEMPSFTLDVSFCMMEKRMASLLHVYCNRIEIDSFVRLKSSLHSRNFKISSFLTLIWCNSDFYISFEKILVLIFEKNYGSRLLLHSSHHCSQ